MRSMFSKKIVKTLNFLVICILLNSYQCCVVCASGSSVTRLYLQDSIFQWHTKQKLIAKLTDADGTPLSGKEIWFYKKTSERWEELGFNVTDEGGAAYFSIYVTMMDGTYYFQAVFKGDEIHLPSSDVAEIIVVGDIDPASIAIISAIISLIVLPAIKLVTYLYEEQKFHQREDIKALETELNTWKDRAIGAPPETKENYPEDYFTAKNRIIFWQVLEVSWAKSGKIGGVIIKAEQRIAVEIDRKQVESDFDLGRKLRIKGKELWDSGRTEEERKRGAQMFVVGTELIIESVKKTGNIADLKKLGEVSGYNPTVDFHIGVIPEKTYLTSNEKVRITINVVNQRAEKSEVWLSVSFKDKNGATYNVPKSNIFPKPNIEIDSGSATQFIVEWAVPENAPKGPYEISVDCWKDDAFSTKYTDDFEWETLFYVPEFHVEASPEKAWYQPGEKVVITINVENLGGDKNIWLDATFLNPQGELCYPNITPDPNNVFVTSGETKTFIAEWTIPKNAPLGAYSLYINCYKEAPPPGVCPLEYTDDFDCKVAFYCYNLDIISPSSTSPAVIGDPNFPSVFTAKVKTGIPIPLNLPGVFSAKINGKNAKVNVIAPPIDPINGIYTLQITPPIQAIEGSYNLTISLDIGHGVMDSDCEIDAVTYSTGANVDVMLVLDKSGSMSGEKIKAAKEAAKLFIDLMRTGDMVGVASFSDYARVDFSLTEINSDTIRESIKSAIDIISAGGSTSIGAGLRAGYNELLTKGNSAHPWAIVLMSDGLHNTPPHPDTVLPDIRDKNIRVFTIGLGTDADASLLSHIAHDSGGGGGKYYFAPSSEELGAIYNNIAGIIKAESVIKEVEGSIDLGQKVSYTVEVDPTIYMVTFTVTWTAGTSELRLIKPDGTVIAPTDLDVFHKKEATYETYTIRHPMTGKWMMEITATRTSSSVFYTAIVTARTNLTIHALTDKHEYLLNEPVKIIATLTKAGEPITEAIIYALIEKPDKTFDHISLYDDGKHSDGVALDGIYANYYCYANVSGSYTINIYASGKASPEIFTREAKQSIFVAGIPAGKISVTPTFWNAGTIASGQYATSTFRVSSTSIADETAMISATDLTDIEGNIIKSDSVFGMPSTFTVPAGGSNEFYARIYVPLDTPTGNYTGSIILISTANTVSIRVNLAVMDTIPPAAIFDLSISDQTLNSITLTWTAPGDDGNIGTASMYDIRYSTEPITKENWDEAIQCEGEPMPQPAGSKETFTVTNLAPGKTYYFAIKTADEIPNWSNISNVAKGFTSPRLPSRLIVVFAVVAIIACLVIALLFAAKRGEAKRVGRGYVTRPSYPSGAVRACPLCGGVLRYDSKSNMWYCEKCRRYY